MKVDRTGTFLCREVDRALGETKKQCLPQLTIKVQMLKYYDTEEDTWVDFEQYDMETNAYFILLYTPKGKTALEPTLSYEQLQKVYGWDGKSFEELTLMDAPKIFMVRVEDNDPEYADKNPFVVNWIDDKDADPRGGLKKLDTKAIKALDKKFSAVLKQSGKKAAPATAKKNTKPVVPKTDKTKSERVKEANEQVRKDIDARETAQAEKAAAEVNTPAPSMPPPKVPPKTAPVSIPVDQQETKDASSGGYTKHKAWEFVVELSSDDCTDDQRTAAWRAAITEVGGEVDEGDLTPEQWNEIAHKVIDDIGKF